MLFYECLDLMTEQCRNVRLDLCTSECQHLLSLFSQSSFFVPVMKSILMTNSSQMNDEHCIGFSFTSCDFYGCFFFLFLHPTDHC